MSPTENVVYEETGSGGSPIPWWHPWDVPLFCSHYYYYYNDDDKDDPNHNHTVLKHYELHMDTFPFWNNESTTR